MEKQNKKSHRCEHTGCTSSFNRPYRLAQHLLSHNNQKAFQCDQCSKSYTNKSHLNRHVKSAHQASESDVLYSCPTCLKSFANRQNLKRHINTKHTLRAVFSCDICKRDFKKKNQLKSHMFQHTGIKAFSCDICIQDFISLYDKRKHMKNHKTYTCNICNIQFERWSKCVKHKKTDHEQEFECDHCGRSFKQRIHIVRHMKQHMGLHSVEKKFSCPYDNCKRLYSRNSNLKQHILIKHVRNMVHECSICKAQLCTKTKLTLHMKLHEFPKSKTFQPKTKEAGRKERKDLGIPKTKVVLKLTGYKEAEDSLNVAELIENCC